MSVSWRKSSDGDWGGTSAGTSGGRSGKYDTPAERAERDAARPAAWRRRRVRSAIAWVLVGGAAAELALGWVVPIEITGSRLHQLVVWLAFMVRTFTFHAGLGVACVAVYCVLTRLYRQLLVCVVLMAVTLGPAAWSYREKEPEPIAGLSMKVMSCNLLVGSGSAERAVAFIREQDPDVIFFQEYTPEADRVLRRAFNDTYPHVVTGAREDAFGQAVYCKVLPREVKLYPPPVAAGAAGRSVSSVSEPQIRCMYQLGDREIVLQNVHDMPPASLTLLQDQLRYFEWLEDFTGAERRPVIIAGDFNTTLNSTPMRRLLGAGFQSTHEIAGRGRGSTWVDVTWLRNLPGVRIDHMLLSPELTCDYAEVGPSIGSDHRPIVARVGFARDGR